MLTPPVSSGALCVCLLSHPWFSPSNPPFAEATHGALAKITKKLQRVKSEKEGENGFVGEFVIIILKTEKTGKPTQSEVKNTRRSVQFWTKWFLTCEEIHDFKLLTPFSKNILRHWQWSTSHQKPPKSFKIVRFATPKPSRNIHQTFNQLKKPPRNWSLALCAFSMPLCESFKVFNSSACVWPAEKRPWPQKTACKNPGGEPTNGRGENQPTGFTPRIAWNPQVCLPLVFQVPKKIVGITRG